MGLPMCLNVAQNGEQDVIAYDICSKAMQQAEMGGAHPAESLEAAASSDCSVIVTMLPGCDALNEVMPKLLASVTRPCVFIDCSTVAPSTSRHWNNEAALQNHTLIDAPVSGGVKGAQDATLTFMVGCQEEAEAFAIAKPLLDLMGKRIISLW